MQWYIDDRECCVRIRDKFNMTKGIERESAAERGPKADGRTQKECQMEKRIVFAGIILCSWFLGAYAQGTTGTISGTVKDQQGAAVAGASVRIVNDETGESRFIPADSAGRYWVSLSPGNYRISIEQQGFEGVEVSVTLPAARDIVVNFERREASSGGSRAIVSSLEPLSATIAPRTVRELPLSSRSYDALIPLVPGVIPYTPGVGFSSFEFGAGPRFSAAGGRGYTNSFLLDGTDINDHANGTPGGAGVQSNPGIEAVRELTAARGLATRSMAAPRGPLFRRSPAPEAINSTVRLMATTPTARSTNRTFLILAAGLPIGVTSSAERWADQFTKIARFSS